MRATGIVRRIDDLGRVVIPKEIRKNLHIMDGEPLEIFITKEGGVVFQKYMANYSSMLNSFINDLDDYIGDDFPYEKKVEILKSLKEIEKIIREYEGIGD